MSAPLKKLSEISLFYPAYNEAGNIEEAVKQALIVLPTIANKFEIIIVNDGSKDATKQIGERLAKKYPTVKLVNQANKGYGGALKKGFSVCRYEWIFFTDSDLQFDLSELKKFIKFTNDHSLVIGYRLNRAEGFKRKALARALKIWNRILLGFPSKINDIDCAFKLIHKDVLTEVNPLLSDGAMLSTELLLKAHRAGFTCKQIGVNHYQRMIGTSTGSNINVILKAIKDTFTLQALLIKNFLLLQTSQLAFFARSQYSR